MGIKAFYVSAVIQLQSVM